MKDWIQANFGAVYVGVLVFLGILTLIAETMHRRAIRRVRRMDEQDHPWNL